MGKRRNKKLESYVLENITLEKFVNGGQALGYTAEGKPLFVWGGLAGERVDVLVTKSKKGILEGVVEKVKVASENRVEPENEYEYLSTSPWQILRFDYENQVKLDLLKQTFKHEAGIDLCEVTMFAGDKQYGYRNKMEYNFWGDEDGLHLALHKRGSGQKIKLEGSVLASETINKAGESILSTLNNLGVFAGDLKSLILRSSADGKCVGALFVKKEDFSELELPEGLDGLVCYYSNPKSPASVITKELWKKGEITLEDKILDKNLKYDVNSFFQLNLPVFEEALRDIKKYLNDGKIVDFYGGTGSIGISLINNKNELKIVELDEHSAQMAKVNIKDLDNAKVFSLSAEESLEKIVSDSVLVVDPPRAGLHKKVVQSICEVKPKQLIYLSCSPVTQARDLKEIIEAGYKIKFARGYNFFPKTPHIESLIILEK
ncbi:MAG: class I SAM-dependent RNA methyltransferase [Candidatus Nomurabacteria bacterium]|nr:MAG: class I SAM-dependent RNA methyltransferase [Candidatus Nomurabacteria bacterium]